jgi:hypothetical protein
MVDDHKIPLHDGVECLIPDPIQEEDQYNDVFAQNKDDGDALRKVTEDESISSGTSHFTGNMDDDQSENESKDGVDTASSTKMDQHNEVELEDGGTSNDQDGGMSDDQTVTGLIDESLDESISSTESDHSTTTKESEATPPVYGRGQ